MNIRSLAIDTLRAIRKKQNWFTNQNRIDAINTFEAFLATNPSEEAILTAAKLALQGARIGSSENSSFRTIMGTFIQTVEPSVKQIVKENKEREVLAAEARLKMNVKNGLQTTLNILQNLNTDLITDYNFQKNEEKRSALENKISQAFRLHHLNTGVRATWVIHLSDIRSNKSEPSAPPFYRTYATLHADVKNAIENYRSFLAASPKYLEELRVRRNNAAINQDATDIVMKHAIERKETRLARAEAGIFENKDLDAEKHEDQQYLEQIQRKYGKF